MSLNLKKSIGILGGGQLASMLTHSAQKMGYKVHIYSPSASDPAGGLAHSHTEGSLNDLKKVKAWSKKHDIITFESEFTNLDGSKIKNTAPSIKVMELIRDRLSQKKLLKKFNIPTSPFSEVRISGFEKKLVLKQRLFGYDGYGTVICKKKTDLSKFITTQANLEDWIQEDFIPFKKELALSIARNKKNEFCILPLVETFQKDAKCFWVKGPVKHKKLNSLVLKVKKMLKELNYEGIIAIELFETQSGELLVNELAPRVHNSAHYSIEALNISQFDLHNLAILNEKLPKKVDVLNPFAMVNLIGKHSKTPKISLPKKGSLHWYGKSPNKPGRKMGHITLVDKSLSLALKSALKEERLQKL